MTPSVQTTPPSTALAEPFAELSALSPPSPSSPPALRTSVLLSPVLFGMLLDRVGAAAVLATTLLGLVALAALLGLRQSKI